jgi:hypothetical protein
VSFLAPAFLLLAGAAAIPLLVHLLRRRMDQRVDFPAARYLARAERENSRKLRLRNLLLMLLRVLAVLFVAAAAARPVGRVAGTGHAPTAVAIVIDNGLSSSAIHDGRAILEGLKAAARRVVAASTSTDQVVRRSCARRRTDPQLISPLWPQPYRLSRRFSATLSSGMMVDF